MHIGPASMPSLTLRSVWSVGCSTVLALAAALIGCRGGGGTAQNPPPISSAAPALEFASTGGALAQHEPAIRALSESTMAKVAAVLPISGSR